MKKADEDSGGGLESRVAWLGKQTFVSDAIGAIASGLTFALKVSKKKGNRGKSEGLLDNHD